MNDVSVKFLHEVLEASAEVSLPVCIHLNEPVGHNYPGKYEPSLLQIYELIKKFPEAVVILSHWGGGLFFYELMPEVSECLKNVFYDTSATPYIYNDKIYETALKIISAEKIIFGSDYPLLGVTKYKNSIEEKVESIDDRKKIFAENAKRIMVNG
jgi:predicted TIM-barrel fold metal-dependent hydrolase